jgi:uncharacterized protein (DUF4415 family)
MPDSKDSCFESKDSIRDDKSPDADMSADTRGKKIGRPRKSEKEKYKPTHICLHPLIVEWAKAEAEKRGIGYQSVINETLLQHVRS